MGQDVQLERLARLAVPLNQPEPGPETAQAGPTFIGGIKYLLGYATEAKAATDDGAQKAELTLAIRDLESAAFRWNRAMAMMTGTFGIADIEAAASTETEEGGEKNGDN